MFKKTLAEIEKERKDYVAKDAAIVRAIIKSIQEKKTNSLLKKNKGILFEFVDFYESMKGLTPDKIKEYIKKSAGTEPVIKILIAINILEGSALDWENLRLAAEAKPWDIKAAYRKQDKSFLISCIDGIVAERVYEMPSAYIEKNRYLPKALTPKPGFYDYNYTPYLREIVDHFSPLSPIQEIVLMKSAQIGATTGILEAVIAYNIGCVPMPQLYVTADKELVTLGMRTKVERMLDSCGLREKIFSQTNSDNKRRTGDTKTEKEYPGGFLHAIGARNPGKLRQMSYPIILFDELDGFPDRLGDEGSPIDLARNRSIAYARKRKLLYLSTPLVTQTSQIYKMFLLGDQRYYNIMCKHCGAMIDLKWYISEEHTKTGDSAGIFFLSDDRQRLDVKSIHYKTQCCGGKLYDHDKSMFLKDGIWIPTETPYKNTIVSYQMNSLYAPPGMYSWEDMCYDWLKAWDAVNNRVKDIDAYKEFRNTKQGLPFEIQGDSPEYNRVISHRRMYTRNKIPNKMALKETGSKVVVLTCAVDVQKDLIYVHIMGWCRNGVSYTVDFREIEGETQHYNKGAFIKLQKIIEDEIFVADDKTKYRIRATLIDAGYNTDAVFGFCSQYSSGVYPIFGRDWLTDGVNFKKASKTTLDKAGTFVFHINTSKIKDKIAASFKAEWNEGTQPDWRPNYPEDLKDDFFKMYAAEYKAEKRDAKTNKLLGIYWVHKHNAANHGFDTHCYNIACLEVIAESACIDRLGLESLSWRDFWEFAEEGFYYGVD